MGIKRRFQLRNPLITDSDQIKVGLVAGNRGCNLHDDYVRLFIMRLRFIGHFIMMYLLIKPDPS